MTERVKRLSASLETLRVFIAKGGEHQEFGDVMDGQLHFLSLDPEVAPDFPVFFNTSHLGIKAQRATGDDFWNSVARERIAKCGVQEAEVAEQQMKLISTKILGIAKAVDVAIVGGGACSSSSRNEAGRETASNVRRACSAAWSACGPSPSRRRRPTRSCRPR